MDVLPSLTFISRGSSSGPTSEPAAQISPVEHRKRDPEECDGAHVRGGGSSSSWNRKRAHQTRPDPGPHEACCPITCEPMNCPVQSTVCGHSFERDAIMFWIKTK